MPEDAQEKRFLFNGSAVAFAARIRHPENVFVNAAAPSHLPVTGGLSETRLTGTDAESHHYKDIISFTSAYSRAEGDYLDPRKAAHLTQSFGTGNELPTLTNVQTRLEGFRLNLGPCAEIKSPSRVFHAPMLEISMESTSNRTKDPISFRTLAANYGTVTLATANSAPVELKVHTATEIFGQCDTKQKLVETFAKDDDFRKKYGVCFYPPGAKQPGMLSGILGRHEIPNADKGPILVSFVTHLEWVGAAPEGTQIENNRLTVEGLGRIYFGEMFVDHNNRRPSLLRFELGPCVGGEAICCEMSTNGAGFPPIGN